MTWQDRERCTEVDVDVDGNSATVEIVETTTIAELFDAEGELRLWEDSAGWSGYELDAGEFFRVNVLKNSDEYAERDPVAPSDVATGIEDHIKDPKAGRVGQFVRAASPPPAAPPESVATQGGAL